MHITRNEKKIYINRKKINEHLKFSNSYLGLFKYDRNQNKCIRIFETEFLPMNSILKKKFLLFSRMKYFAIYRLFIE